MEETHVTFLKQWAWLSCYVMLCDIQNILSSFLVHIAHVLSLYPTDQKVRKWLAQNLTSLSPNSKRKWLSQQLKSLNSHFATHFLSLLFALLLFAPSSLLKNLHPNATSLLHCVRRAEMRIELVLLHLLLHGWTNGRRRTLELMLKARKGTKR